MTFCVCARKVLFFNPQIMKLNLRWSRNKKLSCFSPSRDIFIYFLHKKFSKFSKLHVLFGSPGVIQGNIDFHRNVTSFQLNLNYICRSF